MTPRDQLLALNDELRRLKASGQRTVPVTLESLAQLQAAVRAKQGGGETVAAVAAVPAMAAVERGNAVRPSAPIAPVKILRTPPPIQLPAGRRCVNSFCMIRWGEPSYLLREKSFLG